MKRVYKTLLIGGLLSSLFVGVVLASPYLADWAQATRTGKNAGVTKVIEAASINHGGQTDNRVHPGELFFVHHHFSKSMECLVQGTRYLIDTVNLPHTYYSFRTTTTTLMMPGEYDLNEAYTLPEDVPFGTYQFQLKTVSRCGGHDYYTMGFDVTIVVVPPPAPVRK